MPSDGQIPVGRSLLCPALFPAQPALCTERISSDSGDYVVVVAGRVMMTTTMMVTTTTTTMMMMMIGVQ